MDLDILTAQKLVEDTQLADGTHIENPLAVNEEIIFKKEEFAKLKFQYLEQETREKFLRAILSSPPLFVEQKDVDEYEVQNRARKAELKELKVSMSATVQKIQEKNSENVSLYHDLQTKLAAADALQGEISELEETLRSLFPDDPQLVEAMLQQDTDDSVLSVGAGAQRQLAQVQQQQVDAEARLAAVNEKQAQTESTIGDLTQQLARIQSDIDSATKTPHPKRDPEQLRAQWLEQMSELLQATGVHLEIAPIQDGRYRVRAARGTKTAEAELDESSESSQIKQLCRQLE